MTEKRAKVEINWDENLEQKVEKKFNEWSKTCGNKKTVSSASTSASAGGLYCIGFIGAAIYFIQTATSFWMGVVGILKALVWPGFLVYELFKFLQM